METPVRPEALMYCLRSAVAGELISHSSVAAEAMGERPLTLRCTVAGWLVPAGLLAVYGKLSSPVKPSAGVYVTVVPFSVAMPWAGCDASTIVAPCPATGSVIGVAVSYVTSTEMSCAVGALNAIVMTSVDVTLAREFEIDNTTA